MSNNVKILRSTTNSIPNTLPFGEFACSDLGNGLNVFLGNATNQPVNLKNTVGLSQTTVYNLPGTYNYTFNSNAKYTLVYLTGSGGGGAQSGNFTTPGNAGGDTSFKTQNLTNVQIGAWYFISGGKGAWPASVSNPNQLSLGGISYTTGTRFQENVLLSTTGAVGVSVSLGGTFPPISNILPGNPGRGNSGGTAGSGGSMILYYPNLVNYNNAVITVGAGGASLGSNSMAGNPGQIVIQEYL